MFAVFPPSTDSTIEIRDHAVKDRQFFRYKAKPDLVIKPDQKIGSTLSLEEHQPCIQLVRLSQSKQLKWTPGIRQQKNSQFNHEFTRTDTNSNILGSARASRVLVLAPSPRGTSMQQFHSQTPC